MQKWEYLQLSWFEEEAQRRFALNGEFKHAWNARTPLQVLNELGAEGWELVAMDVAARESFFKRPLAAPA